MCPEYRLAASAGCAKPSLHLLSLLARLLPDEAWVGSLRAPKESPQPLLGGSWVLISRVIIRVTMVIALFRVLTLRIHVAIIWHILVPYIGTPLKPRYLLYRYMHPLGYNPTYKLP